MDIVPVDNLFLEYQTEPTLDKDRGARISCNNTHIHIMRERFNMIETGVCNLLRGSQHDKYHHDQICRLNGCNMTSDCKYRELILRGVPTSKQNIG